MKTVNENCFWEWLMEKTAVMKRIYKKKNELSGISREEALLLRMVNKSGQ